MAEWTLHWETNDFNKNLIFSEISLNTLDLDRTSPEPIGEICISFKHFVKDWTDNYEFVKFVRYIKFELDTQKFS